MNSCTQLHRCHHNQPLGLPHALQATLVTHNLNGHLGTALLKHTTLIGCPSQECRAWWLSLVGGPLYVPRCRPPRVHLRVSDKLVDRLQPIPQVIQGQVVRLQHLQEQMHGHRLKLLGLPENPKAEVRHATRAPAQHTLSCTRSVGF